MWKTSSDGSVLSDRSPFDTLRANGSFPNVLSEVEGQAQDER